MKLVVVNLAIVHRFVWWSTAAVIVLGITREIMLAYGLWNPPFFFAFGLDNKHSIQAWQQSSLAFMGMSMSALFAGMEPQETGLRRYWIALAIIMLVITIEQQISVHHLTMRYLEYLHNFRGFLYFSWVVWAIPLCLGIALWFVPFLLKLPRPFGLAFFASGAVFLGGAIGMETIGGLMAEAHSRQSWKYKLEFIAEESLESIGLSLFVVTCFQYWRTVRSDTVVAVADPYTRP